MWSLLTAIGGGILVIASLATAQEQRQQCYWPNGSRDTSSRPCSTGASAGNDIVPCCYGGHYCLDNGLCWAKSSNTMYRGSCTDPDFASDNCGQFCLGNGWGADNSHSGVWTCGDGRFACHSSAAACGQFNFTVDGGQLLFNEALAQDISDDLVVSSGTGSASGVIATVTTTVTASPSSTGGPGDDEASDGEAGISTAAAAGIGAGVGVPLAIAVATLLFLLFRERKKRKSYESQLIQLGIQATSQHGAGAPGGGAQYYHAVPFSAADVGPQQGTPPNPAELKGSSRSYELHT